MSAVCLALVYLGAFVWDAEEAVIAFALLLTAVATPWMGVTLVGFALSRGHYHARDLQVFNERQRGGAYWFTRGVNVRGMAAWVPAAVVGLLFVNIPGQFEGPLRNTAEDLGFDGLAGVDVSLIVAIGLAAILYVAAELAFPEPRAVFGPDGPRFVRASDATPPPIEHARR
jgi:purine-cytosine permease-like protein